MGKSAYGCVAMLFLVPFALASSVLGCLRVRQVHRLERVVAHVPFRQGHDGPVRLEGTLVLEDGPIWAWRGTKPGGKTASTVCARRSKNEPRLKVGDTTVSLRAMFAHLEWEGVGEFGDVGPTVHLSSAYPESVPRAKLPEPVPDSCAAATAQSLVTLPAGTPLYVLGCQRGGELVPCGDGVDLVSLRPLREERARFGAEMVPPMFMSAWFSILALSLSLLVLGRLPSLPEGSR